ncbi:MAG: hypothetical protein ACE5HC_09055 [Candidatus Binatia bacterium]
MKRWLLIGGGLIVVIIIAVIFFVFSSLDSLIKTAVEKYGSEITQTDVRLNAVKVSVTSGEGALRGLSMGNPKGFKTERAFRLGEISLKLDVGTVAQNPVVIKEIAISAPEVTYELGSEGSNIDAIKRNVDAYTGKGKSTAKKKTPSKDSSKEGRKLVIENLYVRNGKVNISSTLLQGKTLSAPLPDIHLKDIGKKKGGATPGEVTKKLLDAIKKGVAKAVATVNTGQLLGKAKEGAAAAKGAVKEGTKGAVGTVKKLFGN